MKKKMKEKEPKEPLEVLFHTLELVDHLLGHLDSGHQDLKDHLDLVVQGDLEDHKMDHHLVDPLGDLVVQDLMGHLEAEVVAVEEDGGEEGALMVPSEEGQTWDSEEEEDLEVVEEVLEAHQGTGMKDPWKEHPPLEDLQDLAGMKQDLIIMMMDLEEEAEGVLEVPGVDGKKEEEEGEGDLEALVNGIKRVVEVDPEGGEVS